ncbi:MAG: TatD family hydrolase [Pseudomonadota bacterium]
MAKKKNRPAPESLGLACFGVDSHAHLSMDGFGEDVNEAIERATAAGVAQIGNVFLGPDAYLAERGLFEGKDTIFFLLGIHPNDSQACTEEALATMKACFTEDARLKAVGEIGLDYYWDDCPKDIQEKAFRAQLAMAKELDLPVAIHSRDAHDDSIRILEEEGFAGRPVLWHCFGSDWSVASRLLDNGWHISIPGPVTYSANQMVRDAVRCIPLDKLMIETDSPYLSAEPYRGKRNEPAYTVFTAQCIAEVRTMEISEIWKICGDNARRFFGLKAL